MTLECLQNLIVCVCRCVWGNWGRVTCHCCCVTQLNRPSEGKKAAPHCARWHFQPFFFFLWNLLFKAVGDGEGWGGHTALCMLICYLPLHNIWPFPCYKIKAKDCLLPEWGSLYLHKVYLLLSTTNNICIYVGMYVAFFFFLLLRFRLGCINSIQTNRNGLVVFFYWDKMRKLLLAVFVLHQT